MFKKGDKIHLHDGTVHTVRRRGAVPKLPKQPGEVLPRIRGFVRGALVDCQTGEAQAGDWHENYITTYGHGMVIKNFAGLAGSSVATAIAIGSVQVGTTANWSSQSALNSDYPIASDSAANAAGGVRMTVAPTLAGTWTMSQTASYAATQITHQATLNAVAQYANTSIGAGTALSFATFDSSTKGTTQSLAITYSWLFSTA